VCGPCQEPKEGVIHIAESELAAVDAMVFFMYHFHYEGGDHVEARQPDTTLFHIEVYRIADVYGINSLKTLAQDLLKSALAVDVWELDTFANVIHEAYAGIPTADRHLRDIVVEAARQRMTWLVISKTLQGLLSINLEFAVDFGMRLATSCDDDTMAKPYKMSCDTRVDCGTKGTVYLPDTMDAARFICKRCNQPLTKEPLNMP
jgi:hypothetical protein